MSSPITPIRFPVPPAAPSPAGGARPAGVFGQVFADAVQTTEGLGENAASKIGRFLAGEGEDLHDVVLEAQKAQLSFELFTQVRNKVVEAYQEVMRTQI